VTFEVRLSQQARDDLNRLADFIIERELARSSGDFELADRALATIHSALRRLGDNAFTCRKAGADVFLRELVIPFGHTGYVALFDITDQFRVTVLAVRHQREDDYF
jgi:plasmid stabilization system protein ParE